MKFKRTIMAFLLTMIATSPYAFAVSSVYISKTAVYFNIPSDATFQLSMPLDYTSFMNANNGTTEALANSTDWVSFNFTSPSQTTLVQASQKGTVADTQAGVQKPIFFIDPTGNVNVSFGIRVDAVLASKLSLMFNATCSGIATTVNGCQDVINITALTNITEGWQRLVHSVKPTDYLNVTLYANTSGNAAASGESTVNIYINATAN